MARPTKAGLHYAWIVLGAACVLAIAARADSAAFAVFVEPLVALFGWKRGDISFAYALAFLLGLPATVAMGWLGDRFGVRPLMLGASVLISVGTVLMGTITELWQFYLYYALFVGSMGHAAFTVLLPVILTRWFKRHMGIAIGCYWGALGAGPVLFAPLFSWMIETRGWQNAFTTIGVSLGFVLFAFSLLIRTRPAEKGLTALGDEDGEKPRAAAAAPTAKLRDLMRERPVWYLMGIHHLGCAGHAVILAHGVSMAHIAGVPMIEAAGVLSVIAGTSAFSRFAFSILTEKFGGRSCLTVAMLGQSTSVLLLLVAHEPWHFYAFAVVFGICYGGEMVGFPIINRQLFGANAPLGSIYSFQMVGASIGMALGGWLGGLLFDMTGTYTASIIVAAAIGYLAVPLSMWLPRHERAQAAPVKAVAPA
ncbi:MAG TPA: MFS transporter [Burkholderiales bacterium]|nr:MFS transporter [Burkholderiales bacterium]